MDRDTLVRTAIAAALTLAVLLAWSAFGPQPPSATEQALPPASESEELGDAASGGLAAEDDPDADATGARADAAGDEAAPDANLEVIEGVVGQELVVVRTAGQEVKLHPQGGRVVRWRLTDYREDPSSLDSPPIDLVTPEARAAQQYPLTIDVADEELNERINEAWYRVEVRGADPSEIERLKLGTGAQRVGFRWADGRGLDVSKALYLDDDKSYLSHVEWSVRLNGRRIPGAVVTWGPGVGPASTNDSTYTRMTEGVVIGGGGGSSERYDVGDLEGKDLYLRASTEPRWLALDARYFAVAMIPTNPADAYVRVIDEERLLPAAGDESPRRVVAATGAESLTLYTGPKKDSILRVLDARLDTTLATTIDWGFFGWAARPLFLLLTKVYDFVGNWGIAIIIITALIKLLFVPLTHRSMIKMRQTQERMGRLQPKVQKIKQKYKDKRDMEARRKMNEEMMDLYKQEGVNPMSSLSGCLPLLLQLPVLWAMLSVLTVVVELRGAPFFGWIVDLSAPDPYFVTPIVMGLTMFYQQLKAMTKTEDPQQKSQQRIMLFMPLLFTWFFIWAPAGLVIYWLVNSVLGIVQQIFVNRHAGEVKQAAVAKG